MTSAYKKIQEENAPARALGGLNFMLPKDAAIRLIKDHSELDHIDKCKNYCEEISDISNSLSVRHVSDYMYKFQKHEELYQLGHSFCEDYHRGKSCYGIYDIGSELTAECIVGLVSFFASELQSNSLIISYRQNIKKYQDILGDFEEKLFTTIHQDHKVTLLYSRGFYILDINQLSNDFSLQDRKKIIDGLLQSTLSVFWDLPSIVLTKESPEIFLVAMNYISNVTFIANLESLIIDEVNEVAEYYQKYAIERKGFITLDGGVKA